MTAEWIKGDVVNPVRHGGCIVCHVVERIDMEWIIVVEMAGEGRSMDWIGAASALADLHRNSALDQ